MTKFIIVMVVWIAGQADASLIEGFRSMKECKTLQRNYERSVDVDEKISAKCVKLARH